MIRSQRGFYTRAGKKNKATGKSSQADGLCMLFRSQQMNCVDQYLR